MYAQKKSIDNVHIVRERDRQRLRDLVTVVLVGLPIGLFLALFTYQNLEVIRLGHEATGLQKRRAEIENENKALQLELDRLTSLQSVEQKVAKLGFQPTDARAVVRVQKLGAPPHQPEPEPAPEPGFSGGGSGSGSGSGKKR
jgi:hypothetical protein